MTHRPTRKRIRLPRPIYRGSGAFSITIATAGRAPCFTNPELVHLCTSALDEAALAEEMDVLAYCFMPDHLHLLAQAGPGGDLISFVKRFKQLVGYRCKQRFGLNPWQKGYYDHVLRKEEDIEAVARYIFENPTRAGITEDWTGYPYSGGNVFRAIRYA